jgi:hypothetical protein
MFPTLASVLEERMKEDPELMHVAIHAFNQWLYETWQFDYQGRIFTMQVGSVESTGLVNLDAIRAGETSTQFNNFGGLDRFWLGPEAGQPHPVHEERRRAVHLELRALRGVALHEVQRRGIPRVHVLDAPNLPSRLAHRVRREGRLVGEDPVLHHLGLALLAREPHGNGRLARGWVHVAADDRVALAFEGEILGHHPDLAGRLLRPPGDDGLYSM